MFRITIQTVSIEEKKKILEAIDALNLQYSILIESEV